jgi:hypothetical protein
MKAMKPKKIITDLTNWDSIKHMRATLLVMVLHFMSDDNIDDRSDVNSFYIMVDNHLLQIQKYQKKTRRKQGLEIENS